MAERAALLEFLNCHICSDTFNDPVTLSCNHNFCGSCLQTFWEQTQNKNCPICKRKSSKEFPAVNFSLKELEQMSSLSESISAVEAELQKDKEAFLSSSKDTQSRARAQSSLSDPQLLSGALIDVAKHVGNLSFRVWEKMKEKVHFSLVLLDPNTANRWLYLSDDLTSVRNGETSQKLPDNPERNMKYCDVFGSEGFRSGKHSWEVEVGDHPHWNIGVAKECVNRKGECSASPKDGFWCLSHDNGEYTNGDDQTVTVTKSLQKIRVQLDYDRGEVSFYNPEDMTHIYTHKDTFTEKLLPYFNVGESGGGKTSKLQICPTD
uniref:Uncharacterized protein n=1 Tax=Oryzias melastigma TaxID=30732 RepID=A0A3B3C0C1_ORYME